MQVYSYNFELKLTYSLHFSIFEMLSFDLNCLTHMGYMKAVFLLDPDFMLLHQLDLEY